MITIQKIGTAQAQTYYREHYVSPTSQYYKEGQALCGHWQGKLAEEWGLKGAITDEHFERVTAGKDPHLGIQLIEWRKPEKEPDWVRDDDKWKEHVTSLYGLSDNPLRLGPEHLTEEVRARNFYERLDAVKALIAQHSQAAPNLRVEISGQLSRQLGLPTEETKTDSTEQHIAAWDVVLRAHKSVSLVALTGQDARMMEVIRGANNKAIAWLEKYMQARMGGWKAPETTGKWLVATFEHDTARPVNGYAAPLVHHHNLVMNMTAPDLNSQLRAVWSAEFYKAQSLAEAVFQSEIALGAQRLGYEIKKGPTCATEIAGFSQEYIDEESPRHRVIRERLQVLGLEQSVEAGKLVAMETRENKIPLTPEQQQELFRAHGEQFGQEADAVVAAAIARGPIQPKELDPAVAVEYARDKLSERFCVFESYEIQREALQRGHGSLLIEDVETEVEARVASGNLVEAAHARKNAPEHRYTTPEQQAMERDSAQRMLAGQNRLEPIWADADLSKREDFQDNPTRLRILEGFLKTQDQVTALNGAAGSAKTSSSKILAEVAGKHGWKIQGVAPTGNAVTALSKQGIPAKTIQRHVLEHMGSRRARTNGFEAKEAEGAPTLYLVDEASLVGLRTGNEFLMTLRPQDRAIFIGDDSPDTGEVGQHTSVEAGRFFYQLQQAGMKTAHLRKNYRQKTPELKEIVGLIRKRDIKEAVRKLGEGGGIAEIANRQERFVAIGDWYIEAPDRALVVVPDNESRIEINNSIRESMRTAGYLESDAVTTEVLVARDLAGAERTRADRYRVGDVVRFEKDIESLDVDSKSYAEIMAVDPVENRLTIRKDAGDTVSYNPARTGSGVSVFEKRTQGFGTGERVQFTASDRKLGVTNRTTGQIVSVKDGIAKLRLDEGGRSVSLDLSRFRHLDYAYTSTSHLAQARTVGRCAVQIDTDDWRTHSLVNQVMTYVASSRPEDELKFFTDRGEELPRVLGRQGQVFTALSEQETRQIAQQKTEEYTAA